MGASPFFKKGVSRLITLCMIFSIAFSTALTPALAQVPASPLAEEEPPAEPAAAEPLAPQTGNTVRISQFFGGGGGSGYYKYDYVELFNSGTSAVDLTGWSLQYGPAIGNFGGTEANLFYAFPSDTLIQPGKYLLVQIGSAGTGIPLPVTPDFTTTAFSMAQTSGKGGFS